jgi:hypothetical protein
VRALLRRSGLVAVFCGIVAAAALLTWTPPFVGLGLAVGAAFCWCVWLERNPPA